MEDENEVLDWGNEDDELQMSGETHRQHKGNYEGAEFRRSGEAEDAEDAVSVGGDEEDFYAYDSRSPQDASGKTAVSSKLQQQQQSGQQNPREREPSLGNSQKTAPQSSPQRSPDLKRSQSLGKMTHALPPKPPAVSVPYMHPSHPSSIEATAMSKSTRHDKKANGSITKPALPVEEPLPPDWEARRPSHGRGVYYYNTRTHESTWTCPVVLVKAVSRDREKSTAGNAPNSRYSTEPAEHSSISRELTGQVTSDLSYEDRHYRPEGLPIPTDIAKRDEVVRSNVPPPMQSQSPPHSPIIYEREHSPPRHAHNRPPHSHRVPSPESNASDHRRPRDSSHNSGQASAPARRWGPPRDSPQSSSHQSTFIDRHQHADVKASPNIEDSRNYQNDAGSSSAPRHRSPPPSRREPPQQYEVQTVPSSHSAAAQTPRLRSRFDKPARPTSLARSTTEDDIYVPDDILQDKENEDDMNPSPANAHIPAKRRRMDDVHSPTAIRSRDEPPSYPELVPERALLMSPTVSSQPHAKKRHPLPPQDERFRASRAPSRFEQSPMAPGSTASPQGRPDDSTLVLQRHANIGNAVLPGPRHKPQPPSLPRDNSQPDFPRNSRAPPSGPSAAVARHQGRAPPDASYPYNDFPSSRDRDAMDVDLPPPPKSRAPVTHDAPIRPNSGMYADREMRTESTSDGVPTAPRAMSSKPANSSGYPQPFQRSASGSPAMPLRNAPGQDYRTRDRSPPPHITSHDGWGQRDPSERFSQSSGPPPRYDPSWNNDAPRGRREDHQRGRPRQGPFQPVESRTQSRQGHHMPRRPVEVFPDPLPQASGTNSVPIGSRRPYSSEPALQVPQLPPISPETRYRPLDGGSSETTRARHIRGTPQSKDSYERPPHMVMSTKGVPSVDSYDPPAQIPDEQYRRSFRGRNELPSPSFERHQPPHETTQTNNSRPRRDIYYGSAVASRFGPPVPQEAPDPSAPRIWIPREQSPPRPVSYTTEERFRSPTPPPASAEPSPLWEASSYVASEHGQHNDRYPDSRGPNRNLRRGASDNSVEQPVEFALDPAEIGTRHRRKSIGLEGRLSQHPYSDRHAENSQRPHPSLAPPRRESYHEPVDNPDKERGWTRGEQEQQTTARPLEQAPRTSKPVRIRRPPPATRQDSLQEMGPSRDMSFNPTRSDRRDFEESVHRPSDVHRRGGSLLDRLSLDAGGGLPPVPSPSSLRDRVQLPAKRDIDEMMDNGSDSRDMSYDGDDGDAKRARNRRNNKMKPRRGGKRGGAP